MAEVLQDEGKFEILAIASGEEMTSLQLIELAGRTAYQSQDKITEESATKFVENIRKRGHESVIEHSFMSVKFYNLSRGFTHEMVRHRLASFLQESTRYVDESNLEIVVPPGKDIEGEKVTLNLPSGRTEEVSVEEWADLTEQHYRGRLEQGWETEDARQFLPIGVTAEIVVSTNFREWRHIFQLRGQVAAHWEIRGIVIDLLEEVKRRVPVVFDDLKIDRNNRTVHKKDD